MTTADGIIIKALSGFYYVKCNEIIYSCRAKGAFRNSNECPLVGDYVTIELGEDNTGTVSKIHERKNEFLRPPIANLDKLFIVISTCEPTPNRLNIDKLTAICEYKDIEPVIVITKTDLVDDFHLLETYKNVGYSTIYLSNVDTNNFEEIHAQLNGSLSAFAGNTGVGKSSLLNNIFPDLTLATSHISKKLGRGRHTTRHVELFPVDNGYVADTPGFGSMDIGKYDIIYKDKLELCFKEFAPHLNQCKFTGCSHTTEKGCAILAAVESGEISASRFESYVALYNDAKNLKEWEHQTK